MDALYVYAFVGEPLPPVRVAGHELYVLPLGDIYAAVERVSAAPVLSELALRRQHDIVVHLARRADAIIPARFGSLVESGELEQIVHLRREVLSRTLEAVRGNVQMNIRLAHAAHASEVVGSDQPQTANPWTPRKGIRSGADYLRACRSAMTPVLPELVDVICQRVDDLVVDVRVSARRNNRTTINHLIGRGVARAYRRRVGEVAAHLGAGEKATVTGPWPPFAFAPQLWP